MTPVGLSAQLPSAAKASPAAPPSSKGGGFAHTLQDCAATPEAAPQASTLAERATATTEQPDAPVDPLPAVTPAPVTPLPWPPQGLAGLPGITLPVDVDVDVDAEPRSAASTALRGASATAPGGAMAGFAPASGSAAIASATQPAVTTDSVVPALVASLDDGPAALPLPAELATASDAAPAPPAFAPPPVAGGTPLAMREPPPVLATPLPPADVHADDFGDRFGAQLQWMAGQKIGHARIQVTPHGLGPVEVRLQLDGDRISAEFFSAHVDTRQALEQGLPRLRDLLGEHGFHLAHADVGAQSGGSGSGQERAAPAGDTPASDADPAAVTASAIRRSVPGLLDAYA